MKKLKYSSVKLPPGTIENGIIYREEKLIKIIKDTFKLFKIKSRRVNLVVHEELFTFRKIDLIRWRQNFEYALNQHSKWVMNIMYRGNTMDQNPTYSIASTNIATKFKGQINSNRFDALVLDVQNWSRLRGYARTVWLRCEPEV